MALKYLQFAKATGTGTQTVEGVGFQGNAVVVWTTWQTAVGATTAAAMCIGMTDGLLQSTRHIDHPGGESTTTSAQAEQTDCLFFKTTASSTAFNLPATVVGVFTAFTADGFSINWTTNDGSAAIINALVIGGAIDAKFVQQKITVGSGGTIAVTGVGFQPTAFLVMGGAADEFGTGDYSNGSPFGSIHGFGFSNASDNVCGWTLGRGGGVADNYRGQHTNRAASVRTANLAGASELMGMRITATASDGFTITRDAGGTGFQPVQHILCLRGIRFATGAFNSPGVTGDYSLFLPFSPDVLFLQTLGTTASANTAGMGLAIGAWQDDVGSGGTWIGGVDNANPSVYRRALYTDSVIESRQASSGTVDLRGSVSAVSSSGATIAFDVVPGSAQSLLYMAIADDTFIRGSVVLGQTTTVNASRAVAFGLDGNTNTHSESGVQKVYGALSVTQYYELAETTAPSGVANKGRLFVVDNGSGKSVLKVIFGSGAAQTIATEP